MSAQNYLPLLVLPVLFLFHFYVVIFYFKTNKRIPNDTDVRHGIHPLSPPNTFLQTRELKTKLRYEYSTA
jgi:hypothetical protein